MDDMAIGNPVSLWPSFGALGLVPRHPYSAVPFPSNCELWPNFPDAMQQRGWKGEIPARFGFGKQRVFGDIADPPI
jgi:hypothetical protein